MASSTPRVLIVCRSLPCHVRGGLEFHVIDLASGLAKLGVRIDLCTSSVPASYQAQLQGLGIRVHGLPNASPERYGLVWLRRIGPAIERLRAEHSYDIIHVQEFASGFWRPASDFPARIVLTVHGTITSETPLHPDLFRSLSPWAKARALARYGRRYLFAPAWRRMIDRSAALIVDSQFTSSQLRSIRPAAAPRIHHVPLGVEMDRYPAIDAADARHQLGWPPPGQGDPILLTIGRIEWPKGHDLALSALATMKDLPWRYVIAGEGAAEPALKKLIARLGLDRRVELTGRVDDRRKSLLLAGADLFLWPERVHPAFGLVGLEAMLMGAPVLASRRGAIPELLDDGGGWLFDFDPAARGLAEVLRPLLTDPATIQAQHVGLRERALARFNPDAMASATLAVYESALVG